MNRIENIAITAMEECAEVAQAISKGLRFGYDSRNPIFPETNNAEDIMIEYYQLQAMMELLCSETGLNNYFNSEEIFQIKNEKIRKFLAYQEVSKEIGNVS